MDKLKSHYYNLELMHKSPLDTAKVSHAWTTFKSNIDHVDKKVIRLQMINTMYHN